MMRNLLIGLFASLSMALPAAAQEPLPAVLPTVVVLIEDSANLGDNWEGDPSLVTPDSRLSYLQAALVQLIQTAPLGMNIYVVASQNDPTEGWVGISHPGLSQADQITAIESFAPSSSGARNLSESFALLMDDWLSVSLPDEASRGFTYGPFQYDCDEVVMVLVGTDIGEQDTSPSTYTGSPINDFLCNDGSGFQGCFLDNVTHYAYNTFSAPFAGVGSVKSHSIVLDPNRGTISPDAVPLFQAAANQGQGGTYAFTEPGGLAPALWAILTDSFSGTYSNAGVSVTPTGDTLFATFFEVDPGHPLYRGHLLAFELDNDPTSTTFGQVVEQASSDSGYGELWDAGARLASRETYPSETNQGNFLPMQARNGFTAAPANGFYSTPIAFDASEVAGMGTLAQMLVDPIADSSNPTCLQLDQDFDFDCDVDDDDAQILVDFVRGESNSTFLHTGIARGTWKLGDTGRSLAVPAMADGGVIPTTQSFRAYADKIAALPSIVYIASNAGMLHAFYVGPETGDPQLPGSEYWFYVPRSKALYDTVAANEFDGHSIEDLMRGGQTYVNDGTVIVEHMWFDGYHNGLSGCSDGYQGSERDGNQNPDGCEWHRVVVWTGGYGARHVYALDVSNPADPKFLWEKTNTDSGSTDGAGRAVGSPAVASFVDEGSSALNGSESRWIVVWPNGSQGPSSGLGSGEYLANAAVYIADLDPNTAFSPTDYVDEGYSVPLPAADGTDVDTDGFADYSAGNLGLFGNVSVADIDGDGSVDVAYIGDSEGNVFKTSFNPRSPASPTRCLFATANSADAAEHVFYRPAVFYDRLGNLMVFYASGSPFNIYETSAGGLYAKNDPDPFGCSASVPAPCAADSDLAFQADGYLAFTGIGEKMVGDPIVAAGRMFFATHVPGSDPCTVGDSRLYGINVNTCGGGLPDITGAPSPTSNLYHEVQGLISAPAFANDRLYTLNLDGTGFDTDNIRDEFQVARGFGADVGFTFASVRSVL